MSRAAPGAEAGYTRVETHVPSGGTVAALPRLPDGRGTAEETWMAHEYHADFTWAVPHPDGTTAIVFIEMKSWTASGLRVALPREGRRMTPDEFDAMLVREGILASVPTPRPVTPQDEARLREVPPLFRWRRSITDIIREARDRG